MPKPTDHAALLESAQSRVASAELSWLRNTQPEDGAEAALQRLFSDEGGEALEQSARDGRYRGEERVWVTSQLAELARARVLLEARPQLAALLAARVPLAHGTEAMTALVTRLVAPADREFEPGMVARALEAALAPHARRWLELLDRAEDAARTQRTAAEKALPVAEESELEALLAGASGAPDPARSAEHGSSQRTAAALQAALARASASPLTAARASGRGQVGSLLATAAQLSGQGGAAGLDALVQLVADPDGLAKLGLGASASPSEVLSALERMAADASRGAPPPSAAAVQHAERWLEQSDDAARELTRWLVKRSAGGAAPRFDLPQLMAAVRGREWDGLARPSQRFFRIAAGARALGFERDMNARMRGELGTSMLAPFARCVALAIPDDVRVVQPGLEYGLLSDFAAAQATGEALALALSSPALSVAQRRPVGRSVSRAFGGLFAQLRADREYLMRVDGLEREVASNAARHTAVWLLLRSRIAAATFIVAQAPVRSEAERSLQLTAASERALGKPLAEGMSALALLIAAPEGGDFSALADGCALHGALRERFDHDFYRNPRVSDVLRGAAARGNGLTAAGLFEELGASPEAGITRVLELVG